MTRRSLTRSEDSLMILARNLQFHNNNTFFALAFIQFMDFSSFHIEQIMKFRQTFVSYGVFLVSQLHIYFQIKKLTGAEINY